MENLKIEDELKQAKLLLERLLKIENNTGIFDQAVGGDLWHSDTLLELLRDVETFLGKEAE